MFFSGMSANESPCFSWIDLKALLMLGDTFSSRDSVQADPESLLFQLR